MHRHDLAWAGYSVLSSVIREHAKELELELHAKQLVSTARRGAEAVAASACQAAVPEVKQQSYPIPQVGKGLNNL